jgi:hypothetical protein
VTVRLQMDGIQEFKAALRRLPEELQGEADAIVATHAEAAGADVVRGYAQGPTGNLKRRVMVTRESSRFGTSALVKSRAPHASIYESGTQQRRTAKGYNRGRMPQASAEARMIPKVIRWRSRMVKQLIALLQRAGFEVKA